MRRRFIKLQNAIALREHNDEGATMVEHGLIVSLIALDRAHRNSPVVLTEVPHL